MKKKLFSPPLKVSLLYALIAGLWIIISDRLVDSLNSPASIQTYKGWFFVIVTAVLLYLIINKLFEQIVKHNEELLETQKELYKNKALLDYILNNVPQSIFWKDTNSVYLGCNKIFAEMAGIDSPEKIIGKTDYDLPWPREDAELYIKDDKEVIGTNKIKENIEENLRTGDGRRLLISTTKIPLLDKNNKVMGVFGVFEDITKRRAAEEELKTSEARYRMLFESNPHPMWVYNTDTFKFLAVNDAAVYKYGYTKKEFLTKTIKDIRPDEDVKNLVGYVETRDENNINSGVWKHKIKTGEVIFVEIHSHKIFFEGNNARLVLINDVTERRKAEEALRSSEIRHRSTLENMEEGYQIIGFDWRYIYLNDSACRQGQKPREELIGRTMTEIYPGIEKTSMFEVLRKSMNERISNRIENEFIFPDGSSGWFQLSIGPVPEGIFIISLDISERKHAVKEILKLNAELEQRVKERTQELEKINKELEAFTYSVSHDLRSPLRAIDGFSKIIMEDYSNYLDAEGKRLFSVIRANTSRMDSLITDLLSLSRVTRSGLKLAPIDMHKMVNAVFEEILSNKTGKNYQIKIGSLPVICGDASLIWQVWHNLISNAVKYTSPKENRSIEVNCITDKENITYYIKDNGVGFNPDYAHKLFGVFQRLHSVSEFEGTGVGLAIVERIIHRHNGRVWGEGKINEGAVFYFSLPKKENCYE